MKFATAKRTRRGANTVELALALPVLLLFVLGGFEMARANMIRNLAANAAYEGAREAVVAGATASRAETVATSVMHSVGVANSSVVVTPATITPLTSTIKVEVTVPYVTITRIAEPFLAGLQLRGECELTREGF